MRFLLLFVVLFLFNLKAIDISPSIVPIYKEIGLSYNIKNFNEALTNPYKFEEVKRFRRILHRNKDNNLWMKLDLENNSSTPLDRIFLFRWERASINFYVVHGSKTILKENINNNKYIKKSSIFTIPAYDKVTIYIHAETKKILDQFSYMYIIDKNSVDDFIISKERLYHNGLFFGILLTMAMYSFFMYLSMKDKGYLYLGLYQTWVIIVTSDLFQYFFILFKDYPNLGNFFLKEMVSYSMMLFSIIFTKEFLNTKRDMPKLNLFLNFTMVLLIPLTEIHSSIDYSSFLYVVYVMAGIYAFSHKNYSALFYTLGFLGFTIYLIVLNISKLLMLDFYFEFLYAKQIFTCIESFALTMALYLKIRSIIEEREQAKQEYIKQEKIMLTQSKFATMGEMIASIAHQWRQPLNHLTMILANLQLAFETNKLTNNYLDKKVNEANLQLKYMSNTIEDFSSFFSKKGIVERFKLEDVCKYSLDLIDNRCKKYSIKVSLNIKDFNYYENYKNELIQILIIVLNNAVDALMQNSIKNRRINIMIEQNKIIISDNAGGIPENILPYIFDPYFSTKDKKFGTGLGLYTAKILANNLLKGKITVENGHDGAIFIIEI
ncbi:hypothetical protein CRV08_11425 [Halarcobacter ebronensis]|uniref:histidine kinase n=1 Tax=Halarcobacter ebronensis TaxID=1462615 RepID=A0A4Q0YB66_9BACT|nr:sensor histidine kinase [Halarcobacter ebronensis]RXJ67195.1 hypothetical protein CRV08_11425 [Halarcobacter ebronensis]